MNTNKKFEKRVLKSAVKEANKYNKKHGHKPDQNEIKFLKIQTAHPFLRFFSIALGCPFIYFGFQSFSASNYWLGASLLALGIILVMLGIRGRKRELQIVLDTFDSIDGVSLILDAITNIDI